MKECDLKKTITEWESIVGIIVLDPDGFDRKNPNLYNELFTLTEFINGLWISTISAPSELILNLDKKLDDIKKELDITE